MNISSILRVLSFTPVLALAGCVGGSTSSPPAASSGPSTFSLAIFGNPNSIPPEKTAQEDKSYTCPTVDIIEGAAAFRLGRAGSATDVGHQASLIDVARECAFVGNTVTMKVGVQGRMLLGAQGKPGTYVVPVRVAVKRNDVVVASRFARVSVTIPTGESSVAFTHVEQNISLPITANDPGDEYDIFVGFDAQGSTADPRSGRRKRR